MADTPHDPDKTPEGKIRKMTEAQTNRAFGKTYGPSARERTEDFELLRKFGDSAIGAWDWTRIPLTKIYQMRSDPMIQFGLLFIKVPLIRAPWFIECEDPQIAAFVDGALREIWTSFVYQYTNCYDFGYAPLIKEYKFSQPDWTFIDADHPEEPKQPAWDEGNVDAIVWNTFTQIAPEHAEVQWTEKGEFDGFKWTSPGKPIGTFSDDGSVHVPVTHALWATNNKEKVWGSLFGESMLVPVYRYWWSYWFRWALADRAFEKNVDPSIIVYYPPTLENVEDEEGETISFQAVGLDLFDRARSGSTIAFPNEREMDDNGKAGSRKWEWEQLGLETNFAALQDTFNYLDVMKLRSLCVPEQALIEGGGGQSSRNVAAAMGDKFFESQYVRMQEIDAHVNRYLIPQLVALNFPEFKGACRKVTRGFATMDIDLATQIFQLIGQSKPDALSMVNLRDLLAQYNIPLMDANTLARQEAEQAAAEQAALIASTTADSTGELPLAGPEGKKIAQPLVTETPDNPKHPANKAKTPTNEAPTGGAAPPTRGKLTASETETYVEFAEDPTEPFLARMREVYPPMEDDRYADLADQVQYEWEQAMDQGYHVIRDLLIAAIILKATGDNQEQIGVINGTKLLADAEVEVGKLYAKASAKTLKLLLRLLTQSGNDAATKLGFLPTMIGNDFKAAESWLRGHADELSGMISETTQTEIETFLRNLPPGQSKSQILAAFDKHFFEESDFSKWRSERIARGESILSFRMGQLYAAKSIGAEKVKASDASHGTDHTTDSKCRERHGKTFSIEDAIDETLNGTHPRCTLAWTPIPPAKAILSEEGTNDENQSIWARWFGKRETDDTGPES
jgi:hypothetical protein